MLVTKKAPEFKTMAVMPDNSINEVSLSDYKGKKVVLFFYPLDFTFVCPTELLAFNKRLDEFESRDVQVLGCSVDSRWTHLAWKNTDIDCCDWYGLECNHFNIFIQTVSRNFKFYNCKHDHSRK